MCLLTCVAWLRVEDSSSRGGFVAMRIWLAGRWRGRKARQRMKRHRKGGVKLLEDDGITFGYDLTFDLTLRP